MKSPWPTKKLGEICEENKKSSFKVEDADNIGNFPFFTSGGKILNHSQYLVDGENIFLSTGGYAHVKYYKGKASYSADTWSLKVKNALTKYVYYQILEKIKWIDAILFKGTGLRHLQKKEFLNLKIPLPPLPIQQKIVSILDTIQEAINIQNKIIETTKELKKSMMADLFKYGGPSFRKNRKLKKTEIGEIPENWEVVRLGEVVELVNGKRPEFFVEEGVPIYGANGVMGFTNQPLLSEDYILIIGRVGTSGEIHLARGEIWISDNALYTSRINKNKIFIPFLAELLKFKNLKQFASRSTHPIITKSFLKTFLVPLPPLSEQREIAEILQTIDQKIEIEQKKKELYEELFKTMLNKIFTGEIDIERIEI